MNSDTDFNVTTYFDIESEKTRDRAIVTIQRQYEVICALTNGDISSDLDKPLTWFSTIDTNRKSYAIYGMVPLSMTMSSVILFPISVL